MRSLTLILAAALWLVGCQASSAQSLLLTHATLIDGTGAAPRPEVAILVEDGRIARIIQAGQRLPKADRTLDLTGRFVMPGMIDTHVHLKSRPRPDGMMEAVLKEALLGGVTTVRDMGGNGEAVAALARAEQAGAVSPRIRFSMLVVGPPSDFWQGDPQAVYIGTSGFRHLASAADIPVVIADAKRLGASGIKLHSGIAPELAARIVSAANAAGLKVWSHGYLDLTHPSEIAALGVTTLSHSDMLAYEGVADLTSLAGQPYGKRTFAAMRATPLDSPALLALFGIMQRQGVLLEPTLMIMGDGEDAEGIAYRQWAADVVAAARRYGVEVCVGTDALGGSSPNIHAELQLLVKRAGLTSLQAITAATRNGARALGLEAELGTVEAGKRADLVILTADPSRDIRNTLTVWGVIKDGTLHQRTRPLPVPPGAEGPEK